MTTRLHPDRVAADVVTAYLNEVGRYELLTAEEEIDLAQAIEAGREASARLDAGDFASAPERRALRRTLQAGDEARNRFVNSNLRLVVAQARKYRNLKGIDFIDVVQEGNLGLMRAVDKFDWRKGFKFSTYATWWIRQAIQRAIAEKSRTVRIPGRLHDEAATVYAIADRMRAESGRDPSIAEIASESGLGRATVEDALKLQETASLDKPVGEDGAVLADFVVSDADPDDPVKRAEDRAVRDDLRSAIDRLPDRERTILLMRFGFVDGVPKPLDEIGSEFKLTSERIRQIEKRALNRLRHPSFGLREVEFH